MTTTPQKEWLARIFLRVASPLRGLRQLPIIGPCVGWIGAKVVPRDSRVWIQIEQGPAAGLWLRVNPRTGSAFLAGGGEPQVQEALRKCLRPGMTFYDIGANIGFFSLFAARLVGPTGRVVSFEADPEIAARLREHVVRNNFSWAHVEEKAVWSQSQEVLFARSNPSISPDRGLGHVVAVSERDTIHTSAVSLDDYTRANPAPDFIKCDVEGAEVEVFRGARRLLTKNRPGILCEIHNEENRRVLLEELACLGYGCTACDESHILALPS